jgi:hypothetical protein
MRRKLRLAARFESRRRHAATKYVAACSPWHLDGGGEASPCLRTESPIGAGSMTIGRCSRSTAPASPGSSSGATGNFARHPGVRHCRARIGSTIGCCTSTRRLEVRRTWDCGFHDSVDQDAARARFLWRAEVDPGVITVDAISAAPGALDTLDLCKAGVEVIVLGTPADRSEILLRDGSRHIRLTVREGSLLEGPVRLRYVLEGFEDLERKLLTLRRLAALWRLGRMPARLFPRDLRASRWIEMLRTLDALRSGASQRDIAEGLFGTRQVSRDWRAGSDYLRLRIQRLVRTSERIARTDYCRLLRDSRPR